MESKPEFEVQLKIRRPVHEVFEAVVDPQKLSGYFTRTASGRMAPGETVMWSFQELPEEFPVKVREVVDDRRIVFEWEAQEGGYDTRIEMIFEPLDGGDTLVQIRESGWRATPAGVKSSYDNCGGWMHMACCLKAYLEYGINLRAGGVA
jgi:uncharacterized protein YndB with AHSA1/START domain